MKGKSMPKIDLSDTIAAKSDQLNADDLVGGDKIIKIRDVQVVKNDQPVSIFFDGEDKKPWKPCKSMRRILVMAWGDDGQKYKGRSLSLYLDPKVKWAGQEVGGIRIRAMSDIDKELRVALTVTRGKKEPYIVKKLETSNQPKRELTNSEYQIWCERMDDCMTVVELSEISGDIKNSQLNDDGLGKLRAYYSDVLRQLRNVVEINNNGEIKND